MVIRKLLPRLGLSLLALVLADQLALHLLLREGTLFSYPIAPHDPPIFCESQRQSLAEIRTALEKGEGAAGRFRFDSELGWCNPRAGGWGEFLYDWAGSRIGGGPLPRTKTPGVRRVVTIGCSMTLGEEVAAREAWASRLDEARDDIEVANLGVAAFGLDQALLRWRRDGRPLEADEVWLGLLPRAALRVTSRSRPLDRHWSMDVCFKPRFRLGRGDELELLENPAPTLEEVVRLLSSQEAWLAALGDDDPWLTRARAAYAPRGSRWMHHSFVGRVGLTLHERSGRDLPTHFEREGGETYRLLRAIVRATEAEVREAGARFRLVILPAETDLEWREEAGRGYWEGLCEELAEGGIEVVDLSAALEACGVAREELFMPHGHYSPRGNEVVAEALGGVVDS